MTYLPRHNARFAVAPLEPRAAWRALPAGKERRCGVFVGTANRASSLPPGACTLNEPLRWWRTSTR